MEKISWTDRVRNEEVLLRVKEERNILHTIKRIKANWIGHILRRNCLLKHVIEGKLEGRIELTERRGIRRRKQLQHDLKEIIGYWKLKQEALDRTLRRTRSRKEINSKGGWCENSSSCILGQERVVSYRQNLGGEFLN
jgi:hypothetical protein